MKIIPFKNHLQAAALGALLVFAAGCEKEMPANSQEAIEVLPAASFTKQLTIGANNRSAASFVVEVGASEQRLLDEIDASSFSITLNPPELPSNSAEINEFNHEAPQDVVDFGLKPDQKYVTIQLVGAFAKEAFEGYTITFGDQFNKMLREENVAMRIRLRSAEASGRAPVVAPGWWRTPYCGRVNLTGDGGNIKTGVTVYRAYLSGSVWRQSPIHTFEFFNSTYCTKCAHNVAYLDDVWVWRDVLKNLTHSSGC